MRRRSSRLITATIACLGIGLLAATVGLSASPAQITQTSIAGVKLGMTMSQVTAMLGKPVEKSAGTPDNPGQPDGWTRLASATRKIAAYFKAGDAGAVMVTTWNKAYRTAGGIGPCTPKARVKRAYGSALKPSKNNPPGFGYRVGAKLFVGFDALPPTPSPTVTAIALFNPRLPGAEGYAGFVTLSEQNC